MPAESAPPSETPATPIERFFQLSARSQRLVAGAGVAEDAATKTRMELHALMLRMQAQNALADVEGGDGG